MASGITIGSLATGVASNIVKLKLFWDQVHDASDDVRDLIEELENLNSILADMESDQRRNPMQRPFNNAWRAANRERIV